MKMLLTISHVTGVCGARSHVAQNVAEHILHDAFETSASSAIITMPSQPLGFLQYAPTTLRVDLEVSG